MHDRRVFIALHGLWRDCPDRKPLETRRPGLADIGRVGRHEGAVFEHLAPVLAYRDKVIAVGAIAVQEYHQLLRFSGLRRNERTV